MSTTQNLETDNIIELDLSPFSKDDIEKIKALGMKQKLCYRWFRYHRKTEVGLDQILLYAGSRGRSPYSSYRVDRYRDAQYSLVSQRTGETIVTGRTIESVLDYLPDDFFYSL